jgi:hypothetical protein
VIGVSDAALKVDEASSSLRDRPHNEHDIGSVKTDKLQRPNQTVTVSALGLPDLGEGDPIMINISYFTTAKILDKRWSPSGVEYKCQLDPPWLAADLVEEMPMGGVRVRSTRMDLHEKRAWAP